MHSGNLLPGLPIDTAKISQQLGVSKTPVRDALMQLEFEGFVTILPRKRSGVTVNALTLKDVRNLYEMIGALEAAVMVSVFDRLGKDQVAKMELINGRYREAILAGDFDEIYRQNLLFHGVFLDLSENSELMRVIKPRKERLYDFPRRSYLREWELRNCGEHEQLMAAINKGDRDAAATIIRDIHWSYPVQERFIREFYRMAIDEYNSEISNLKKESM